MPQESGPKGTCLCARNQSFADPRANDDIRASLHAKAAHHALRFKTMRLGE
jgi:hypothetical protein